MTDTKKKKSELGQRVITAIIGGAIFINAIYWSFWSSLILLGAVATLSLIEFYQLNKEDGISPLNIIGTIWGITLFFLPPLITKLGLSPKLYLLFILCLPTLFIAKLYDKKATKAFSDVSFTLLGIFYVIFPFLLLFLMSHTQSSYHHEIILGFFFMLWASDSGAYFAGKSFGKTKLFPRISPKKTWEGSIGGLVLSLITALCLSYFYNTFSPLTWCMISIIIVVFGSLGDLTESMYKRSINVKDSASTIPGHGGFLDRFDGLLISSPFVFVLLMLI